MYSSKWQNNNTLNMLYTAANLLSECFNFRVWAQKKWIDSNFMVYTRLVQHSTLTFGQKMKELANVIREYENELIQKMKVNLDLLLKEKYDIVLTDEDWDIIMQMPEPSDWYSTAGKG